MKPWLRLAPGVLLDASLIWPPRVALQRVGAKHLAAPRRLGEPCCGRTAGLSASAARRESRHCQRRAARDVRVLVYVRVLHVMCFLHARVGNASKHPRCARQKIYLEARVNLERLPDVAS